MGGGHLQVTNRGLAGGQFCCNRAKTVAEGNYVSELLLVATGWGEMSISVRALMAHFFLHVLFSLGARDVFASVL